MIIGIGIDLVDVSDMARRLERKTILGVFSETEKAQAYRRPQHTAQIFAAYWAAKEAFTKAIGTGIPQGWHRKLNQIEVVHDPKGKPLYRIGPFFQEKLPHGARTHLTMSHLPQTAAAVAIVEVPHPDEHAEPPH